MAPTSIRIRGARVHNLKNLSLDIPLQKIVAVAGVSGSGKSSLALGVLYAEGSRRYLESLSTYTRRRMTGAERAAVDEVLYVPAALALRQRPAVPGIRSTFGTGTELLNSLRLLFSRCASHRCPNGHTCPPTLAVAAGEPIVCPTCGESFFAPGAEDLAFNSGGACPRCEGTGITRTVDESTLVPDESLTIDEGAVAPWQTLMWSLMKDLARDMGVRTDVPFRDLTPREREIVFRGPAEKRHVVYQNKTSGAAGEMDFTYYNATYTVENALSKVKDEKGMKRLTKFLREETCPDCAGTRLSSAARAPRVRGINLADACKMTLGELCDWVRGVPASLPPEMRPMAQSIIASFTDAARRLLDLGLSYLTLDRPSSTLSTGERQRMQLARAVRNRTTGVLYVLDEPSIGLHPANLEGLLGVLDDLLADGNSVILVDHDTQVLRHSQHMVELGPGAGEKGGRLVSEGTVEEVARDPHSLIGPYLLGKRATRPGARPSPEELFSRGRISLSTGSLHTVKPLQVSFPVGAMSVITGVSGSGKTTLVLESLVPALTAAIAGKPLPAHIRAIDPGGISRVKLIDASPIGVNVRSTVATYADVHDELRRVYARTPGARAGGYRAGDFSYNTGRLRCPTCDGTGIVSLDVQFLPDVNIPCPACGGSRYSESARHILRRGSTGEELSLPDLMDKSVEEALRACEDLPLVARRLRVLCELGLGYLTLGEETPGLSGGEAQRLKLAGELGRGQAGCLFVFDEPTIGLHPRDVEQLLTVFESLVNNGATLLVIEHDLDVIRAADYVVDMGPGGGESGGEVVFAGTPDALATCPRSATARFL